MRARTARPVPGTRGAPGVAAATARYLMGGLLPGWTVPAAGGDRP